MSLKDRMKNLKRMDREGGPSRGNRNLIALGARLRKQAGPMGSGKRPTPKYDDDYGDDDNEPMTFKNESMRYRVWTT